MSNTSRSDYEIKMKSFVFPRDSGMRGLTFAHLTQTCQKGKNRKKSCAVNQE